MLVNKTADVDRQVGSANRTSDRIDVVVDRAQRGARCNSRTIKASVLICSIGSLARDLVAGRKLDDRIQH